MIRNSFTLFNGYLKLAIAPRPNGIRFAGLVEFGSLKSKPNKKRRFKYIIKEWEKLQVIVQLAEKELYNKNVKTVKESLIQMQDLGKRVKMLEVYMGALKNRVEEYINEHSKN